MNVQCVDRKAIFDSSSREKHLHRFDERVDVVGDGQSALDLGDAGASHVADVAMKLLNVAGRDCHGEAGQQS